LRRHGGWKRRSFLSTSHDHMTYDQLHSSSRSLPLHCVILSSFCLRHCIPLVLFSLGARNPKRGILLRPCTFWSFPVPFWPFTAYSGCGLLYSCYVPTNILLCPASSVDAQPLGFLQWRSSECSPNQTYDLCNYASLLLFLLSFTVLIVFNILLSALELSPYLV
jgi:hypothetical protein